ncbi:tRNA dihydrouridine synthase DusB [Omnitrophica bacterium]|nr:tRNA dihydrouridine synthase DusB [Candidatus Omnitrophota bacterium]
MILLNKTKIDTKIIMAPMSGHTDLPFRAIINSYGCRFSFLEMIDSISLVYNNKKSCRMLEFGPKDNDLGAQVLGSDPSITAEAAHIIINRSKPKIIDLNCACPVKKIIKKRAGAYLLKYPNKAAKIIKKMVVSLKTPVTIKIRLGWSKRDSKEGLKLAKIAQENGVSAVFVHGRTVTQGYSGRVDYDSILEIKKSLKIPVIASGDVLSPELANELFLRTGCDGILVARGALGRPWIFRQISEYLKKGTVPFHTPPLSEIKKVARKHIKEYIKWRKGPERFAIGQLRKIAMWYAKGMPNARRMRDNITRAACYKSILDIFYG